jgi:hypothetical protein
MIERVKGLRTNLDLELLSHSELALQGKIQRLHARPIMDAIPKLRLDLVVLDLRMLKCQRLESCGKIKREAQTET